MMLRLRFLLILPIILACAVQALPIASTNTPQNLTGNEILPQKTSQTPDVAKSTSPAPSVQIVANVHIRNLDGSYTSDVFYGGETVAAVCEGFWCYVIGTELKFWRGCTSDNPAEIGCK